MNQSEFLPITRNLLIAREKSRVQDAMGFASHCLKDWRGLKAADRSNRNGNGNCVISFDSHFKISLSN